MRRYDIEKKRIFSVTDKKIILIQCNQESVQDVKDHEGIQLAQYLATVLTSVLSGYLEPEPSLDLLAGRAGLDKDNCKLKYSCPSTIVR